MHKLVLNSYAKINLYLAVLNQRPDGFHNIYTLFERIDLADKITLTDLPGETLRLTCDSPEIPRDEKNLAFKAALLLQKSLHLKKGAAIAIKKRIPVGAGLGGGSSNAASTLLGLNRLWKLNLSQKQLCGYAQKLGSDVPFFIYDCPFAAGESKGERIKPLKHLKNLKLLHLLIAPRIFVSTAKVYRQWDKAPKKQKAQLTRAKSGVKILILNLKKNDLLKAGNCLFNGLEAITTRLYPGLVKVKKELQALGFEPALMSGSGAAFFALCASRKEAATAYRKLQKKYPVFLARTK